MYLVSNSSSCKKILRPELNDYLMFIYQLCGVEAEIFQGACTYIHTYRYIYTVLDTWCSSKKSNASEIIFLARLPTKTTSANMSNIFCGCIMCSHFWNFSHKNLIAIVCKEHRNQFNNQFRKVVLLKNVQVNILH